MTKKDEKLLSKTAKKLNTILEALNDIEDDIETITELDIDSSSLLPLIKKLGDSSAELFNRCDPADLLDAPIEAARFVVNYDNDVSNSRYYDESY